MDKDDIEIIESESDNESDTVSNVSDNDDIVIEEQDDDEIDMDDMSIEEENEENNGSDDEEEIVGGKDVELNDENNTNYQPFNMNDDNDDDDDEDETYLQKFDDYVKEKVVQTHHPETLAHNNEEVQTACVVVRDDYGNIIDPLHTTIPLLTCYEKARILGERVTQLNNGAQPMVEIDETMMDGYVIALKELEAKKIPFIIQRPLPNGTSEYWRLKDLDVY